MNQQTDNLIKNVACTLFVLFMLYIIGMCCYESGKREGWSKGYNQGFESAKMLYR